MRVKFYLRKLLRVHKGLKKYLEFLESRLSEFKRIACEKDVDLTDCGQLQYLWLEERIDGISECINDLEYVIDDLDSI